MAASFQAAPPTQTPEATVQLMVHNVRSSEGKILLGVYDNPESFTNDPLYSLEFSKEDLKNGMVICRFALPAGTYAFSLLDDENEDNEMNFNILGIPKEGYGFSKDARINFLTPPDFDACKLTLSQGTNAFKLRTRYF